MNPKRPRLRFVALWALLLALPYATARGAPEVGITSPSHSGFSKADWEITGTTADPSGTGFLNNRVTLSISHSGQYWNGSGWTSSGGPIDLYAEINFYGTWTYPGTSGDTLPTGEGEYAISARVTDLNGVHSLPVAGGNSGNNQIVFRLDSTPPGCAILSPAGAMTLSTVAATVTFTGTASDSYLAQPDVTLLIKRLRDESYWDGQHWVWNPDDAAFPATYTSANGWVSSKPMPKAGWDETHDMTAGSYTFTATARDAAGNTTPREIPVTVDLSASYPLVPFGPQQIPPLSANGITQSEMVEYSPLPTGDERTQSPAIVRIGADNSLVTGMNMLSTNGSYYEPVYYPSAAVIKHAADGSTLWKKERELHSVTIVSGDTPNTTCYERWSPADPWLVINSSDYTPYYTLSAMEIDSAGNTYAGFDLSYLPANSPNDAPARGNVSIVAKFNPDGNLIWRSRIENPYEHNHLQALKPLADGSAVALVSNTWQTYNNYWPYGYDSGGQTVVMRVGAPSGNFKHQFGYSELGFGYQSTPVGMEVDPAGNIVVVSTESETTDIHKTHHKIRRIAADGTILRTVTVPIGASPESWRRMRLDPLNGDLFISGVAMENTEGISRSAVLKFDLDNAAGSELVWRGFGPARSGSYSETFLSVSNNSVTVAETAAESNHSNAAYFVSVVTFDKNGQLLWSRLNADPALKHVPEWGGGGGLTLHNMTTDAAGNVYLACSGSGDGLIKMAANGDLQFVKPFPEGYTSLYGGFQREGQMQILADHSIAVLVRSLTSTPERATVVKISNPANVALPLSISVDNPPDQFAPVGSPVTLAVSNTGSPATYQWQKDDANGVPQPIAGATGASLTIANATVADSGLYRVILTNTVDPSDVLTSRKANVTVFSVVGLPEALDTPGLVWETSAPGSWIGQTAVSSDGVDAAINAPLSSHVSSWMQTTVAGPGTFSFYWKSQDSQNDSLGLSLDPIGASDGSPRLWNYSEDFVADSIQVPAGTHTLRFKFYSAVAGNRGFVDRVAFVRDSQAPAVALEMPASGSTAYSLETVSGSATDTIETVTFSIRQLASGLYWNGSNWSAALSELATDYHAAAGTWSHGVALPSGTSLTDGDYEFTVYGRNSAGTNVSSSSIATLYPNAALGVSIGAPVDGGSLNGLNYVSGSASSQTQQVTLQIKRLGDDFFWNGWEWVAYPVVLSTDFYGDAGGWYYDSLPEFDAGDYQFTATATDADYNTAEDSVTASAQLVTGPLVTSLLITPDTADVTHAGRTLSVRLAADSPVGFGTVTLTAPSGETISSSFGEYSLNEGAYEIALSVPRHREAGAWVVSAYLQGLDYRVSSYSPGGLPLPAGSTAEVLIVNTGAQDFSAPQVTSLTMTPSPTTVTAASQEITVTIGVSDDVGLDEGNLTLGSPNGGRNLYGSLSAETRISGTAANGIYRFNVTVPAHAEPGLWSASLYLGDVSERSISYNSSTDFPSGIDRTLTVVNTGGIDGEAPVLTNLTFSTTSVDVTDSSQQVTATLHVTDDLAGLKAGTLILDSPTGPQSLSFSFGAAQRTSGTATDGSYTVSLTIPKHAPSGLWSARVVLGDFSDWSSGYGSGYYDTSFPAGSTTQLQVQNSGQTDTAAPVLTSLSFSKSTINVDSSSQSIVATMQISDALSGFEGGYVGFWKNGMGYLTDFTATAGVGGNYQVSVTIPQGVAAGTWNFGLSIRDVLGNWRAYGAAAYYLPDPLPAGAPSAVTVTTSTQAPFDQWARNNFPAGTPVDQMVFNADPDADGISNLLEYAFNMPPTSASGREQLPGTLVQLDAQGLPTHMVMTYNERIDSSDLVYQVPVSSDMIAWDTTGSSVERVGTTPNPDGVTRRVTVRIATTGTEEKFMRIRVVRATP